MLWKCSNDQGVQNQASYISDWTDIKYEFRNYSYLRS